MNPDLLHPVRPPRAQRGTVLLLTLIVLVVLLIGGIALVRSFDTGLLVAGNIAFKRDLVNQGERVVPRLIGDSGVFVAAAAPLSSAAARAANLPAQNYSATILPTNPQGLPLALLSNDSFAAVGQASNDIRAEDGVTRVRYVVDRLCNATGLDADLGPAQCIVSEQGGPRGGSGADLIRAEDPSQFDNLPGALPRQVLYRVSVRVDGPRGTQTFLQTTFAL